MEDEDHRREIVRQDEKKAKREAKRLQRELGEDCPATHTRARVRALNVVRLTKALTNLDADLAAAADAHLLEGAGRHDEVVLNARERAGTLHAYGHGKELKTEPGNQVLPTVNEQGV